MRVSNRYDGKIREEMDISDSLGNDGGDGEKEVLLISDGCEDGGNEEEEVCEIETKKEKKNFNDKEMDIAAQKIKSEEDKERINEILIKKLKNVEEEKMIDKIHEISMLHKVENKLSASAWADRTSYTRTCWATSSCACRSRARTLRIKPAGLGHGLAYRPPGLIQFFPLFSFPLLGWVSHLFGLLPRSN